MRGDNPLLRRPEPGLGVESTLARRGNQGVWLAGAWHYIGQRWLRTAVLIIAMSVLFGSGGAQAASRDFTLVNQTRYDISNVYLSTFGLSRWIRARVDGVDSGDDVEIDFDNQGPCRMQLKVQFSDGNTAEWLDGFDFCSISTITIFYNGSTRRFTAEYK
jgi:hypothetical protein